MADNFSSSDKKISITNSVPGGSAPPGKKDAKALLSGMTKDVRQRWLIVGGAGTLAIAVLAGTMSSGDSLKRPKGPPPVATVDTTPKGLSAQKDWKSQTGADLLELKQQLYFSNNAQKELVLRMEALRQEIAQVKAAGGGASSANTQAKIDFTLPPPPEPPKSLRTPGMEPPPSQANTPAPQPTFNASVPQPPKAPMNQGGITPPQTQPVQPAPVFVAPEPKRAPARSFMPEKAAATEEDEAKETITQNMVNNERKGFLPAGSFVEATLLSGVEADTGVTAQTQPMPVVIRLDENAILPNAAAYQIEGCHVLASVWGNMSSERIYGRLATLTCVDAKKRLVLSEEVEGSLVDSDGKLGIRGEIQDRQGAKLARSMLAGFAQGMATAFGGAQGTLSSTALGTTRSLIGGDAVRAAGYNGASSATQQLAQFYMKQAENTMPVIVADATRKISVLFTKSKSLKFETTDTYRVMPKNNIKVERTY